MTASFISKSKYDFFIRLFLYIIIAGNIITLSIVFLYPRFSFMICHWGVSEREILLSEGSEDNPNTERLRRIYKLMYFVKDHSEEDSMIYFLNPYFSRAQACKILLPRKIHFLDSQNIKKFLLFGQKRIRIPSYFVFIKEDKPDFCREDEIIWDGSGWGMYKCENLQKNLIKAAELHGKTMKILPLHYKVCLADKSII